MIGQKIKELRNSQGLSLRMLSDRSGVSKTTLSDLENGKINSSIVTVEKIANALSVPINDLMSTETQLDAAKDVFRSIRELCSEGLKDAPKPSESQFCQYDDIEFTAAELTEIDSYIKFILSKRGGDNAK